LELEEEIESGASINEAEKSLIILVLARQTTGFKSKAPGQKRPNLMPGAFAIYG
jgi:hypothetical protein